MDREPPWHVLGKFSATERDRYERIYELYEDLDASWKDVIETGVEVRTAKQSNDELKRAVENIEIEPTENE